MAVREGIVSPTIIKLLEYKFITHIPNLCSQISVYAGHVQCSEWSFYKLECENYSFMIVGPYFAILDTGACVCVVKGPKYT